MLEKTFKESCLLLFTLIICTSITNCRSSQNGGEGELAASINDSTNDLDDFELSPRSSDKYPHPRSDTKWETNILILTNNTPAKNILTQCASEIQAQTEQALSEYAIQASLQKIKAEIATKPELFHWCFYYIVNKLDYKLDQFGLSHETKITIFYKDMASLWVLAKALDAARKVDFYFHYLRNRYIEISEQIFGRPLEVVSRPFPGQHKNSQEKKPAGEVNLE